MEMLSLGAVRSLNCEEIREHFENFLRDELKFYLSIYAVESDSNQTEMEDPFGVSRMLLTLLKLICVLDEKATAKYPLFKEHKLGINPTHIQSLLLPLKSNMQLAAELEEYFIRRQSPRLPSLIGETQISEHSYSVRHAQRSHEMQECKRALSEIASKTENEREKNLMCARAI